MSISILLAEKIAQLFLILLMGYLVVRVGLLKPEDSRVLSVIMVYLVMPCMILNAFQIDNTPEVRTGIAYSFVVAGIMHLLFLALTALLKKPLKLDVIERCAVIYSNASALVIAAAGYVGQRVCSVFLRVHHCAAGAAVDPLLHGAAGRQGH